MTLLLTTTAALFLLVGSGTALADAEGDAALVFCSSPTRRTDLVDAAVSLGLGQPGTLPDRLIVSGRELGVDAWRVERRDDFDRACKALFVAEQRPQTATAGSVLPTIMPFLTAALGVLLTLLVTSWRDKVARGRVQSDALLTTAGDFLRESEVFLDGWTGPGGRPDDGPVRDQRAKLLERLAPIGVLHPRWTAIGRLQTKLGDGPLGRDLTRDWVRLEPESRAHRAEELKGELARIHGVVLQIAYGLGRPIRSVLHPGPVLKSVTNG